MSGVGVGQRRLSQVQAHLMQQRLVAEQRWMLPHDADGAGGGDGGDFPMLRHMNVSWKKLGPVQPRACTSWRQWRYTGRAATAHAGARAETGAGGEEDSAMDDGGDDAPAAAATAAPATRRRRTVWGEGQHGSSSRSRCTR